MRRPRRQDVVNVVEWNAAERLEVVAMLIGKCSVFTNPLALNSKLDAAKMVLDQPAEFLRHNAAEIVRIIEI